MQLEELFERVKIMGLPPNMISVYQSMDRGVIVAWKRTFLCLIFGTKALYIESRAERSTTHKERKKTNGLQQRYYPNMPDVATLAKNLRYSICTHYFAILGKRAMFTKKARM